MRYFSIGIVALGFMLSMSSVSFAEKPKPSKGSASASASGSTASASKPKASPSQELIVRGTGAYMARDYAGATAAFQAAVAADPNRAYAYYMLGQAFRAEKKLDDADAIWQKGLSLAARDPNTRVKLLFVIADLREQQGRWDDAIAAWKAYADFLAAVPKVKGYPATATERIQVIERRKAMEADYGKVKERIQQRERDVTGS